MEAGAGVLPVQRQGGRMSRSPRPYLPGYPAHVVQRGNNRANCFVCVADYHHYLHCLGEACRRYRVALHAYVLMTNHVHLLMTPADAGGISRVMQSLGRRYVQYFNRTYGRSGTLWEGRHRASLVDADAYLLACHRYIELNPVRAGLVEAPAAYRWSSHRRNACGAADPLLTPHPVYESLGPDAQACAAAYRALFAVPLPAATLHALRTTSRLGLPLGPAHFIARLGACLDRAAGSAPCDRRLRLSAAGRGR